MKAKRFSQVGYSLPELLIVLVVLCVLATLALATFSKQKVQLQRQDVARQLKTYLERAKFDSIKRRASASGEMASVTITSPYSFFLTSDADLNGVLDSNEVRRLNLPQNGEVKIVGSNFVFPITVRFNFRGQVTAVDGNNSAINPFFTISDSGAAFANANAGNSNIIAVSPTGTVSFLSGGKSQPQTAQTNVTNTNVGLKINQSGLVGN